MEKRRTGFCLQVGAALSAAAAALSFPAWACAPSADATRLESARYVIAYKSEAVEVAKHFALDVSVCAKPGQPAPESLKVDAHMPEHRHGMNYAPTLQNLGPGRWRAEGLMLHMPGRWEFVFEIRAAGVTDRVASGLLLASVLDFSKEEIAKILQHGPWPPPLRPDPSNRVSGKAEAVALGEKLFFEPRLSGSGSVLCATCHAPFRHFQDARARAFGLELVDRNTPTVVNSRFHRWYGWDGAQDSLWAQSIRPILDPREMNASAAHVAQTLRALFPNEYEKAFGRPPVASDEELLVDAGKALAAYQETLVSARTPFDDFRDALQRGERETSYPLAAQRGLRIFVGKGNCSVCHFGPQFTNGEFADTGVPFFIAPGKVDPGRQGGIERLKQNPFNLLSRYNDDKAGTTAVGTRHVQAQHRNFGEFRVPGLRGVAQTAPYMHNGSLATLREVVKFYSELNEERLHADGEKILKPLRLTEQESGDLGAFLESLSEPGIVPTDQPPP
jgi:cytochrome c peroxidase